MMTGTRCSPGSARTAPPRSNGWQTPVRIQAMAPKDSSRPIACIRTSWLAGRASTVSGIEAALAHGTGPQYAWIAAAVLSAASVTAIEGTARSGAHRRRAAPDKLPELPGIFVGRSGDLQALEEKLESRREALRKDRSHRNSPVVIYLYGPLGIGKSALAVDLPGGSHVATRTASCSLTWAR